MSVRDVLSPFTAWKHLFREPVTIRDPLTQRRGAPRYRGFHQNDLDLCTADMVVEAIGQMSDTSLLGEALTEQLAWARGRLQVDATGRTSEPWLWAAGDMVRGPDVVSAVADGHRVAASIHAALGQPAP